MNLVRWGPFQDLLPLGNQLNRLFDGISGDDMVTANNSWFPLADIYESDDDLVVKVELPGVDPKDVDVRIEDHLLTVRGERRSESDHRKDDYHRIERYYGSFARAFALPLTVDTDNVHAEFKDGVLKINLPKAEQAKSKKIEVGAAA